MLQTSQITHEGSRQGAFLGVNNCTSAQSGLNEAVSSTSAEIVPDEAKNGMLQQKKLHQDQPSSSLISGAHTSPKQVKLEIVPLICFLLMLFSLLTSLLFHADF